MRRIFSGRRQTRAIVNCSGRRLKGLMDDVKTVMTGVEQDGLRLDKAVKELFDVPWSTARTWVEKGKITLDGTTTCQLDAIVHKENELTYQPNAEPPSASGAFNPNCIVYQDRHLIVAEKPADILTVPFTERDMETFDIQLRKHLTKRRHKTPKKKGAQASLLVVHRLDKLTSGLLVFPRTMEANEGLAAQFRDHSVTRTYLALVHGIVKSKTIRTHIMEDRGDGIRGSCETSPHAKVRRSQNGKLAITHVEVLEILKNASLIKCRLDTGRTNQIRIHLGEDGHPLIGERTYNRNYGGRRIESLRLMLHAGELGFSHPITGEPLHFFADPPLHFREMLERLRK